MSKSTVNWEAVKHANAPDETTITAGDRIVGTITKEKDAELLTKAVYYYNENRLDLKARIELIQENAQGALDFEAKPDRLPLENGLAHYKEMKWALERILQLIAGMPKEE